MPKPVRHLGDLQDLSGGAPMLGPTRQHLEAADLAIEPVTMVQQLAKGQERTSTRHLMNAGEGLVMLV